MMTLDELDVSIIMKSSFLTEKMRRLALPAEMVKMMPGAVAP